MNEEKKKFCSDDIFKEVGEFGKYQLFIFILIGTSSTISGMAAYQSAFSDSTPEYRCKLPTYENDTFEIFSKEHQRLVDLYIPKDESCKIRTNASLDSSEERCSSYVYSKKYYERTIVTEWDFVCDNIAEKGLYKSLYFAGTFGVLLIGILADRFGRKWVTYAFVILNALSFLVNSLSVNFVTDKELWKIMFGISRFAIGFNSNIYAVVSVIAVEIVGPSYRVAANSTINYFYILGEFIVLLVGYFVRDYRTFTIYMTVIASLLIFYFWLIPESVRYLIARKKFEEADKIFKRIAKSNNKIFSFSTEELDDENDKIKKVGFKVFFTNFKILTMLLVSWINWFSISFVYFGISLNTEILGGNPYLNFLCMSVVEFGAILVCHFVLVRYGRKIPYLINYFLVAASLILNGYVPSDLNWLKIILVLIAKFAISFNFNTIFVMTSESYPTVIRNTALSSCSAIARIGSTISPYTPLLGNVYFESLPYLLYGGFSIASGLLYFFIMPETKDIDLPENLEDIVEIKSNRYMKTKQFVL